MLSLYVIGWRELYVKFGSDWLERALYIEFGSDLQENTLS